MAEAPRPRPARAAPRGAWRRALALALVAVLPAGCAAIRPGTPVAFATADGSARYEGARHRSGGADTLALTSSQGADCAGELHPTTETATGLPAAFGGVHCEDGRSGMLLLSGAPGGPGGAVEGVMARRSVRGHWGGGPAAAGAGV